MPTAKLKKQVGRGQVASRITDTYYDIRDYMDNIVDSIALRRKLLTTEKRENFIKKYISKMEYLLRTITPEIRNDLEGHLTYIEMSEIRPILEYVAPVEVHNILTNRRGAIALYAKIIERFQDEDFLKAYIKKYSKPLNLYAYYLLRGLKGILKWRIRYAQYLHNERIARANAPPQPQATPPPRETSQYRNRLSTPEKTKSNFTYQWLKTDAELKQTCRDAEDAEDDDECECLITLMDLEPNHAFSVSYKDSNGKTHTDCFHKIVIEREEAKQYTYFRHPILRDRFINMQAIRALKTTSAAAPVQEGGKLHRRPAKRT